MWREPDRVAEALRNLQAQGLIEAPRTEPSPHLFYLTREGERAIGMVDAVE